MDAATRKANLRALIDRRFGGVPVEAARAMGLTKGRVSQLLSEQGGFGERAARGIEEKLGLVELSLDRQTNDWLDRKNWLDEQHAHAGGASQEVDQSMIHLGREDEPTTCTWEFILSAEPLPPRFRLAVPDDALAPGTPRGTVLVLSTTATPAFGHGVLVEDAGGRRYLRRYAQGPGGRWMAEARNTAYLSIDSADGAKVLAVVVAREIGEV